MSAHSAPATASASASASAATPDPYAALSRDDLIARLRAIDVSSHPSPPTRDPRLRPPRAGPKPRKQPKPFAFHAHPTRHIALLIAYHGWPYSGLALQSEASHAGREAGAVVTVEGELEKALEKTRLIEPGMGLEGAEYSRCGRTDRGVSGEGQVVNLWVRSGRVDGRDVSGEEIKGWRAPREPREPKGKVGLEEGAVAGTPTSVDTQASTCAQASSSSAPTPTATATRPRSSSTASTSTTAPALRPTPEHAYPRLLNAVLPPSIRVLAWSPAAPEFDSRFSCSYRHYKYIFHVSRVGSDSHPHSRTLNLDLGAMHRAAQRLVGEHDFRNFCKLDGAKQILSHKRTVLKTYFELESRDRDEALQAQADGANVSSDVQGGRGAAPAVPPAPPHNPPAGTYVFNLIGTAFLWHQVRHVISALFLVGAGLEPEHLISDLLDVERYPGKPAYQMGDPLPLTLHECGYAEAEGLGWRYGPYDGVLGRAERAERVERALPVGTGGLGREGGVGGAEGQVQDGGGGGGGEWDWTEAVHEGREGLERQLMAEAQEAEIRAWQVKGALRTLRRVLGDGGRPLQGEQGEQGESGEEGQRGAASADEWVTYPVGGGQSVSTTRYKPVMLRPMGDTPDVVNAKWREKVEGRPAKDKDKAGKGWAS